MELFLISDTDPPKVRERQVIPKQLPVAHLIKLRDARPALIRLHMLRHDIHRNLAQIEICADSRCGCDSGRLIHILYHRLRKLPRCHMICVQIPRHIDKYLIHRIYLHILRRHIFQVNIVYTGAVFHIICHPWFCRNIIKRKRRHCLQLCIIVGRTCKLPA